MKIRKLNDPPKADAVRDMVRYARNVIEEFRRAKHYKYILRRWQDASLHEGLGSQAAGAEGWALAAGY